MVSERFRCPHCKTLLVKSEPDQLLASAGGFISFGSPIRTCPACRKSIDRISIINGIYDEKPSKAYGVWVVLAIIILIWIFTR